MITFGKGIGGGVVPLSGMVASRRIREVVETSPTGFSYGHTFSGYPLGCAVGCEVMDIVERGGPAWRPPSSEGRACARPPGAAAPRHPIVRGLRGRGLLQGMELCRPDGGRFAGVGGPVAGCPPPPGRAG